MNPMIQNQYDDLYQRCLGAQVDIVKADYLACVAEARLVEHHAARQLSAISNRALATLLR
jgi:hypothetical protein